MGLTVPSNFCGIMQQGEMKSNQVSEVNWNFCFMVGRVLGDVYPSSVWVLAAGRITVLQAYRDASLSFLVSFFISSIQQIV